MSDFVVAVPGDGTSSPLESTIESISTIAAQVCGTRARALFDSRSGLRGLVLDDGPPPIVVASPPRGILLIKGILVPEGAPGPILATSGESHRMLDGSLQDPDRAFHSSEGCFAAFIWNSAERMGYAANDTAASLNLYVGTFGGAHWVTTCPLYLARALRLHLDPGSVMELLGRGAVLAPASLFSGLRRIGVGEGARVTPLGIRVVREWLPYVDIRPGSSREMAARFGDRLGDRLKSMRPLQPIVSDLTGGYDTRVVCSAAHAARIPVVATVTGPSDDPDVSISRRLAHRIDWQLLHFDPTTLYDAPIDASVQRQLLYRTSGELPFIAAYFQLLTRPQLARDYGLHMNGLMGELLRSAPWSQEFDGVGRRRAANIDRLLRYRFLQDGPPSPGLYGSDWYPALIDRLGRWAREIAMLGSGTETNQQCDAIFLWKMTGHLATYTTASSGWLLTIAPLAFRSLVFESLSIPWRLKLTSDFQRRVIAHLSPAAASVPTVYGASARPMSVLRPDREILQVARQARLFVSKVDRVYLGGRFSRALGWTRTPWPSPPFLTEDFRLLLRPRGDAMLSRAIYRPEALATALAGSDEALRTREKLLTRMATIETLCREVDHELEPGFLSS